MSAPTCQWCALTFPTLTAKLIHIHTEHPETIGRGPTPSRNWICTPCGTENPPVVAICGHCHTASDAAAAAIAKRTYTVVRRRPDGTLHHTSPLGHWAALGVIRAIPSLTRGQDGYPRHLHYDAARAEVWDSPHERRWAWLEAATP